MTIKLQLVSWNSLIGAKGLSRLVKWEVGDMIITPAAKFNYKTQKTLVDGRIFSFVRCLLVLCLRGVESHLTFLLGATVLIGLALHIYYPSFPKLNIYPVSRSSLQ